MKDNFSSVLLAWHREFDRPMPWKGIDNPYFIWLSEIILQQTRVEQGLAYYERFIQRFPTLKDLALSTEDEVLKCWEGLGYYSRARNLHLCAKIIQNQYQGTFPNDYDSLLELPGIGPYTAAAIASFAFHLPFPVLDGNVIRVVARYMGIDAPIDKAETRKLMMDHLKNWIDPKNPGTFNQAMMDLGAKICLPQNPNCLDCPLKFSCVSNGEKSYHRPWKAEKKERKKRFFHFIHITDGDELWVQKRTEKDIWKNLYQLPMIESNEPLAQETFKLLLREQRWPASWIDHLTFYDQHRQLLTHQEIFGSFFEIQTPHIHLFKPDHAERVQWKKMHKLAFPQMVLWYFRNINYF